MTVVHVISNTSFRRLSKALGFGAFVAACVIVLGQHQALPVRAAGPTPECGTLASSATWNAAGSPYQICASGVTIPSGITVTIDGSGGPVTVQMLGSGGLQVTGGTRSASGPA